MSLLIDLFAEAWSALVGALVIFGTLGLLVQSLRAAASTIVGSRFGLLEALGSASGFLFVLLFTLLGVPVLAAAVGVSAGEAGTCGPLADLGSAAARLVGALAAIRMLVSFVRSAASSALMSREAVSQSIREAGEAVLGMLLAMSIGPIAAHFLGMC